VTHQYELMVILDPEIDERTVAPSLDKFLNVIRNDGGTIDSVDIWGRRRLAYEINKKTEGIYAVVQLTANASATVELDRQLKLSEAVMRTKVLRAEEAIAQVAEAAKLAEEKAARKAAAPASSTAASAAPSSSTAASAAPAKVTPAAGVAAAAVVEVEAPVKEAALAKAKAAPKGKAKAAEASAPADAEVEA
jgi:small subunit ribosomal protein S6